MKAECSLNSKKNSLNNVWLEWMKM
jgi:hypothetical protein